jgi:ABC-type hemin transport system substrate-binding protein
MSMQDAKIGCPTFQNQEAIIEGITARINSAADILEKAEHAQKLLEEADVLVSCPDYDQNGLDCRNCRTIAALRTKTARLVITAGKLA